MIAHRETKMPDMSQPLSGFTPSRETPYALIEVPAGAEPADFLLRVTPGGLEPGRQALLVQAVNSFWKEGRDRKDWLLWGVKIFPASGRALVDLDGRRPFERQVEPLRSWLRWDLPATIVNDTYEVRITYSATSGELAILREAESLTGTTNLREAGSWKLIVGTPPWYGGQGLDEGWRFDLSWSLGGEPAPSFVAPGEHPALAKIRRAVLDIKNAEAAIEQAVVELKGEK